MTLFPPVVDRCCGTGCQLAFDGRPCWGEVWEADIDEDGTVTHGCEGHVRRLSLRRNRRYVLPMAKERA